MFQVMIMHVDGSKLYKQGVVKMPRVKRHYLFTAAAPSTDSVADTTESSSVKASRPAPCCTRNTSSCSFCNFSLAAFNSLWQAEIWKELKLWAGYIAPSLQRTSNFLVEYGIVHFLCVMRVFKVRASSASPWLSLCQILFLWQPPLLSQRMEKNRVLNQSLTQLIWCAGNWSFCFRKPF